MAVARFVLALVVAIACGVTEWRNGEAKARGAALSAGQEPLASRLVGGADLANLVVSLQQIGSEENGPASPPPPNQPPATAVNCAGEGGVCTIPAGTTATVYYGAGTAWAVKTGVTGSIGCNNVVFGDPALGLVKACRHQ